MTDFPALEAAAAAWIAALRDEGISGRVLSRLSNGLRAELLDGSASCRVNLHSSDARGFSVVYAGGSRELAAAASGIGRLSGAGRPLPSRPWIGSDEAGKGDYFGPLVVSAVCLDRVAARRLSGMGVVDSKRLEDSDMVELAPSIMEISAAYSVVALGPREYNSAFDRARASGRNSLDMLAVMHARAITDVAERCPDPEVVVVDKFGPEKRIGPLLPKGLPLDLRVRGESDPAVAAASILARCEYMRQLRALSDTIGVALPAGSSSGADDTGRRAVAIHGSAILLEIAKYHFCNTKKILPIFTT